MICLFDDKEEGSHRDTEIEENVPSVAEIAVGEFARRTVQEPGATPPSSGVSPGPRGDGLPGSSVKACVFRPVEKGAARPGKCFAIKSHR